MNLDKKLTLEIELDNSKDTWKEKPKKPMNSFQIRDKILIKNGYLNYQDYLKSDIWKKIREISFKKHGKYCVCCRMKADYCHHIGYFNRNLIDYQDEKFIKDTVFPVCQSCYNDIHWKNGKFRTMRDSKIVFCRMVSPNLSKRFGKIFNKLKYLTV